MALATTCPQCKTSFKVIPDQLKLRRGLVRCGVCQHVFSGIDYLRYVDDSKAQQRKLVEGAPADAAGAGSAATGLPAEATRGGQADDGARADADHLDADHLDADHAARDQADRAAADHAREHRAMAGGGNVAAGNDVGDRLEPGAQAEARHPASDEAMSRRAAGGWRSTWGMLRRHRGDDDARSRVDAHHPPAPEREPEPGFVAFEADAADLSPHTQIAPLDDDDSTFVGRDTLIRHQLFDDADEQTESTRGIRVSGPPTDHRGSHPHTGDAFDIDTASRLARDSPAAWRSSFLSDGLRSGHRHGRRSLEIETFGDLVATPGRRYTLIALVGLALIQLALCFRDEIASALPLTRPMLATLGAPLGLETGPVRSIADLSIESFDIQASGQDDRLNLSAVIRNRSDRPVRWPAMELTLTDPGSAIVVRKVIVPTTYLPSSDRRDGIGPRSEQPIRLTLEPRNVQLAGYSVALFYP